MVVDEKAKNMLNGDQQFTNENYDDLLNDKNRKQNKERQLYLFKENLLSKIKLAKK